MIITGYVKSGKTDISLMLFPQMMRDLNVLPHRYVRSSVLNACTMLHYLDGGKQMIIYVDLYMMYL